MALPVNIQELIHGRSVEWDRLEFKQGWNPEDVLHTLCAFANDINNWGGGYIIVGVAEENGRPVLPPAGLDANQLDRIQGELVGLCHRIPPQYLPVSQPYELQGQHILVIWVPAGDIRPYSAPVSLSERQSRREHYIRQGSRSIIAQSENLRRLQDLTARIPFDDRINRAASLKDLSLSLIQGFLDEVKSDLLEESTRMPFPELCRQMRLAKGPDEDLRPVNAGLLFFSKEPHLFFDRAWIEVVIRHDEAGKQFSEKYFKGPLHVQLRDTLAYIRNNVVEEKVRKVPGQAEAERFYNFPFAAIEEAVANAVFHKSYELPNPIEIQIWPDKMEVLSFPGPVPPVTASILASQRRIVAREYRNRRLGDFLKELHLTEGRGTGLPTIYRAMEQNGSPKPAFETDDQSTYFLTVLPVHEAAMASAAPANLDTKDPGNEDSNQGVPTDVVRDQVRDQVRDHVRDQVGYEVRDQVMDRIIQTLHFCLAPHSRKSILENLGLTNRSENFSENVGPAIDKGWLTMTIPDKPKSKSQQYITTPKGKELLQKLNLIR
ncbi:helix-turn-helix domain-containing protein [soil metagenome]